MISVKKSGSGSPTAAKSLDFSGQIVHCHFARQRARVRSLLRDIGRGSRGVLFISKSKHCSSVSPDHLHCFTQRKQVPFVLRVTILAYTNSRFETGVHPAKSDIDETDVLSRNP